MALPQKVIEQLGREPPKTPGWSSQLLMFSSTIFLISLFIFFGLKYGYEPYLNSETNQLKNQLEAFSQKVPVEKQAELIAFYSQLANLNTILKKHNSAAPIFAWLEANTETNVALTNIQLLAATNELQVTGSGKTMDDVNQQMVDFASQTDTVMHLAVAGVTFSPDTGWQFNVTITFVPGFLIAINNTPAQ